VVFIVDVGLGFLVEQFGEQLLVVGVHGWAGQIAEHLVGKVGASLPEGLLRGETTAGGGGAAGGGGLGETAAS